VTAAARNPDTVPPATTTCIADGNLEMPAEGATTVIAVP
jgi:hypothetical protein